MRSRSGGGVQLAARLEHQVVLRVEPHQLDLALQLAPAGGEDVRQHPRVQEERRPHVEAEAAGGGVRLQRAERPPRRAWRSYTVTSAPARASSIAAASPPGPAPTMPMLRLVCRPAISREVLRFRPAVRWGRARACHGPCRRSSGGEGRAAARPDPAGASRHGVGAPGATPPRATPPTAAPPVATPRGGRLEGRGRCGSNARAAPAAGGPIR